MIKKEDMAEDVSKDVSEDMADEAEVLEDVEVNEGPGPGLKASQGADSAVDLEIEVDDKKEEDMVPIHHFRRLKADYENYKRRSREEMKNMTCLGREQVIEDLLAVLDNFSRALETESPGQVEDFKKGMALIYRQLKDVLAKHGLKAIDAVGTPFDPGYHQAVVCVDSDCEDEDDTVVADIQTGYMVGDKVIRPSMVQVAQYKEKQGGKNE